MRGASSTTSARSKILAGEEVLDRHRPHLLDDFLFQRQRLWRCRLRGRVGGRRGGGIGSGRRRGLRLRGSGLGERWRGGFGGTAGTGDGGVTAKVVVAMAANASALNPAATR